MPAWRIGRGPTTASTTRASSIVPFARTYAAARDDRLRVAADRQRLVADAGAGGERRNRDRCAGSRPARPRSRRTSGRSPRPRRRGRPPAPWMFIVAPSAIRIGGRLLVGSPRQQLPPIVPRLRICWSSMWPATSARIVWPVAHVAASGRARRRSRRRRSRASRRRARSMRRSSARRLMSTSSSTLATRFLSTLRRLWPPASTRGARRSRRAPPAPHRRSADACIRRSPAAWAVVVHRVSGVAHGAADRIAGRARKSRQFRFRRTLQARRPARCREQLAERSPGDCAPRGGEGAGRRRRTARAPMPSAAAVRSSSRTSSAKRSPASTLARPRPRRARPRSRAASSVAGVADRLALAVVGAHQALLDGVRRARARAARCTSRWRVEGVGARAQVEAHLEPVGGGDARRARRCESSASSRVMPYFAARCVATSHSPSRGAAGSSSKLRQRHGDLVAVLEAGERRLDAALADVAPRAGDVRPDLDVHRARAYQWPAPGPRAAVRYRPAHQRHGSRRRRWQTRSKAARRRSSPPGATTPTSRSRARDGTVQTVIVWAAHRRRQRHAQQRRGPRLAGEPAPRRAPRR